MRRAISTLYARGPGRDHAPPRPSIEMQGGTVFHFVEAILRFPDGVKTWERVHITIVDGEPLVDPAVFDVVGCLCSPVQGSGRGVGRADRGLLRTGSDEDRGEGLEVFDELVELGRLENVVGRSGEVVGGGAPSYRERSASPIWASLTSNGERQFGGVADGERAAVRVDHDRGASDRPHFASRSSRDPDP